MCGCSTFEKRRGFWLPAPCMHCVCNWLRGSSPSVLCYNTLTILLLNWTDVLQDLQGLLFVAASATLFIKLCLLFIWLFILYSFHRRIFIPNIICMLCLWEYSNFEKESESSSYQTNADLSLSLSDRLIPQFRDFYWKALSVFHKAGPCIPPTAIETLQHRLLQY